MSKKLICVVISLIMLTAVFAGCGSDSTTDNGTTTTQETKAAATTAATTAQEQVTISFVNWNNKAEEKPIIDAFMAENPNIKVETGILQGDQYGKLLRTRVLSGDAPDVFTVMPAEYPSFAREGYLLDVTNEPGTAFAFSAPGTDVFQRIDGKLYGAALTGGASAHPVYYNKKIFTKLGLTPPTNLDEFYAACDKIKASGIDPLIFGAKDGWTTGLLNYCVNMSEVNTKYQPGLVEKVLNGEVKISDIYGSKLNMMETMVKKGYIGKPSLTLSYDQANQYFLDGKCAMLPNGPWFVQDKNYLATKDFELGAFLPPFDQIDGKYYLAAGANGQTLAVSAKSKHIEEAKKLFNFFFEKDNLRIFIDNLGYTSLIPNLGLKTDPILKDFNDLIYNSPDKVKFFIVGAKDDLTAILTATEDKTRQNIIAGSTTEAEIKVLEAAFEKVKSTLKFD